MHSTNAALPRCRTAAHLHEALWQLMYHLLQIFEIN